VDVLERLGFDVTRTSAECCGMAGSFGYKSDYYELSMQVGAALEDEIRSQVDPDTPLVVSGVSCREQLDALFDRTAKHPIEVVEASLSGS
jgi:Fe-S oxidoreductase